jgi:hypothetical protein
MLETIPAPPLLRGNQKDIRPILDKRKQDMLAQNKFSDISYTQGYGAVSEAQSRVILNEAGVEAEAEHLDW